VRSPWLAAASTFSAFLVCGIVPLVPFLAGLNSAFWVACTATSLTFVLDRRAYGIGAWLRDLTGP